MKTSKRQRRTAAALTAPIRAGRKEVWSSPAEPKRTTAHSFSNKTQCSLRVLRGTCSFSETHADWRLYETVQHDCRRHIPQWCHQVTAADSSVYVFPPPPHLSVRSSEPGTPDWRRHFHTCRGAECEGVLCVCVRQEVTRCMCGTFSSGVLWPPMWVKEPFSQKSFSHEKSLEISTNWNPPVQNAFR